MTTHKKSIVQEHAYSDTIYNTRVAIIGPLPPPLGGVSVHVQRTMQKLMRQGNTIAHYDPQAIYPYDWLRMAGVKYGAYVWYMIKLSVWLVYQRPSIVIYHLFYARTVLPELLLIRLFKIIAGSTVVLVEHDCRHMYERGVWWRRVYSWLLRGMDQLVLIGSVTALSYTTHAIDLPQCSSVESAFLPPNLTQQELKMVEYPESLLHFLRTHSPVLLVSAFECVVWQGKDLYGLDQAIEVCARLRATHPDVGLVIVLGSIGHQKQYQQLCALIDQYQLQLSVYVLQGNYTLWPLFAHVDIFMRPTLSDGASVSVQEALLCGVTTIASDVCWRPEGTVVYKTADSADLYAQIEHLIRRRPKPRASSSGMKATRTTP